MAVASSWQPRSLLPRRASQDWDERPESVAINTCLKAFMVYQSWFLCVPRDRVIGAGRRGFANRGRLQRQRSFYWLVVACFLPVLRLMPLLWLLLGMLLGFLHREMACWRATNLS